MSRKRPRASSDDDEDDQDVGDDDEDEQGTGDEGDGDGDGGGGGGGGEEDDDDAVPSLIHDDSDAEDAAEDGGQDSSDDGEEEDQDMALRELVRRTGSMALESDSDQEPNEDEGDEDEQDADQDTLEDAFQDMDLEERDSKKTKPKRKKRVKNKSRKRKSESKETGAADPDKKRAQEERKQARLAAKAAKAAAAAENRRKKQAESAAKAEQKAKEREQKLADISHLFYQTSKEKKHEFDVTSNVTGVDELHTPLYRLARVQYSLMKIMHFNGYEQVLSAENKTGIRYCEVKAFVEQYRAVTTHDERKLNSLRERLNSEWMPTERARPTNLGLCKVVFSRINSAVGIPFVRDIVTALCTDKARHCVAVVQQDLTPAAKQQLASIQSLSRPPVPITDGKGQVTGYDTSQSLEINYFSEGRLLIDVLNEVPQLMPSYRLLTDDEKELMYHLTKTDRNRLHLPPIRLGGVVTSLFFGIKPTDVLLSAMPHHAVGRDVGLRHVQADMIDAIEDATSLTKGKKRATRNGKR